MKKRPAVVSHDVYMAIDKFKCTCSPASHDLKGAVVRKAKQETDQPLSIIAMSVPQDSDDRIIVNWWTE